MRCKTVKLRSTLIWMVLKEIDLTEKVHIRKALLKYCTHYTLARGELRTTLPQKARVD